MAQLQKGTTYITGDQVTAANLNALVDSGTLIAGAITDQTAKTVPLAADTILLHSAADTALRKTTMTQLFATPQPLGATTPSSVAATTGTFSSTLAVTGVATLGNGAILGTPASGTVTNLTGTASININGTVGATTPSTVAGTTGTFSGAFGIGGAVTSTPLTVKGAAVTYGLRRVVDVYDTTSMAAGVGGGIGFFGQHTIAGGSAEYGTIAGVKENATAADYKGNLVFAVGTMPNGVTTEVGRFTSTGLNSTAIGATTASTGAFSTLSATTSGSTSTITLTDTGANGANFKFVGDGATTPNKYIRTRSGELQVVNSAYSAVIASVSDAGSFYALGGINSTAIGATTASTGAFSTLGATSLTTIASSVFVTSRSVPVSGAGLEMYYQANASGLLSYDRTGSAYKPLSFDATTTTFHSSGSPVVVFSSTGAAITGVVSATTDVKAAVYGYFGSAGVAPSASNPGFAFSNPLNVSAASWSAGVATTSLTLVNVYNGNGVVGTVVTNGTATAWNTSSDARLKTNLRDITNSSVIIDALKPRRFDWLTFTKEKDDYGFVAQEAYEVYPKMVTVGGDDPAEKPWGMDASKLIPVLVAELQSLRKRLAALEAK